MSIVTRFAPSPTGFLHIGGARTALFNWLYARNQGGKFLLRIEDTDKKRSTQEAIDAILNGMKWLGLDWDDEVVYQTKQENDHKKIAEQLIESGNAYYCYCTPEELTEMREAAQKENKPFKYDGRWRDRDASEAPEGVEPTVRLKTPLEGETVVDDKVQGKVTFPNEDIDDLIILRSDGTPTYMLAVVADDHSMGVTHVIRGDDHLNNTAKQQIIYEALGWDVPTFAHIPLIHGQDGAKLSKRHGALGVEAYKDMGYMAEAMRNYLVRLGWSHGDDEIFSTEQAIEWFNLEGIGKSPARFDFDKLNHVNAHYIKAADDEELLELNIDELDSLNEEELARVKNGVGYIKEKAQTLIEINEKVMFFAKRFPFSEKAKEVLSSEAKETIEKFVSYMSNKDSWELETLKQAVKDFADSEGLKFGKVGQPLRAALVGDMQGPNINEIMFVLGKDETLARLTNLP